ncbi:retroviral-like aspartic protease family protein [Erythrobacteraceae bacterium WH01K]|nr:retroviral-like aspartic protease family protein [Erythrobacteraceae bacterium WH01K]
MPIFRPLSGLLAALLPAVALAQDAPAATSERLQPPTPALIDEALEIGGEDIEARKLRSRMTVVTHVNGKGPYRFVVDSGADTSVIGRKLAGELALEDGTPVLLHAVTESKVVDRVLVDELRLGPTVTTDLELPVLEEKDLGGDGMIGLDALVEQRLMLDFEKRIITVDDGAGRAGFVDRDGIIVVTARMQRGQLILTEVKAGREAVDAVVDTGTEVTIGNSLLREKLKARRPRDLRTATVYGVTGKAIEVEFAIVNKLKIGPITLTKVPIVFADIPPFEVFGIADKPSLLLGTDLMEQFRRVSLDFGERRVRFQLKRCEARGVTLRTNTIATRIKSEEETACVR